MGLIKANNAPPTMAPFSMADIENQARAIVSRARQQADHLLAAAQTEASQLRQKAYDQGFIAGREDGLKKGTEDGRAAGRQAALGEHREKLEQLANTLAATITQLDQARCRLESAAATEVVKLAVAIARRVTKLQGAMDNGILTENIHAAMKLVVHGSDVRIAVNPCQKQMLLEVLPQLRLQWPAVTHVELAEDASLAPGGCRISTAAGEIDAELDRQIDRIAADLLPASCSTSDANLAAGEVAS